MAQYGGEIHGLEWAERLGARVGDANMPDSFYRSCGRCGRFSGLSVYCPEHQPTSAQRRAAVRQSLKRGNVWARL